MASNSRRCHGESLGETTFSPPFLRLTLLIFVASPQNQPLPNVHPGPPGATLTYVSRKGGEGSGALKDKHLPARLFHTPGFGVTQRLPKQSGVVWINSAAVAHQTLAHDLRLVKDGGERAAAKRLATLLETHTTSVADYYHRLQAVKNQCPLQSCCAKEDLHCTLNGGKTVYKNFEPVNALRGQEEKNILLNFNNESEKNRVVVFSEKMKEDGRVKHVQHVAVEDGFGGVEVLKAASLEKWPRKATKR